MPARPARSEARPGLPPAPSRCRALIAAAPSRRSRVGTARLFRVGLRAACRPVRRRKSLHVEPTGISCAPRSNLGGRVFQWEGCRPLELVGAGEFRAVDEVPCNDRRPDRSPSAFFFGGSDLVLSPLGRVTTLLFLLSSRNVAPSSRFLSPRSGLARQPEGDVPGPSCGTAGGTSRVKRLAILIGSSCPLTWPGRPTPGDSPGYDLSLLCAFHDIVTWSPSFVTGAISGSTRSTPGGSSSRTVARNSARASPCLGGGSRISAAPSASRRRRTRGGISLISMRSRSGPSSVLRPEHLRGKAPAIARLDAPPFASVCDTSGRPHSSPAHP